MTAVSISSGIEARVHEGFTSALSTGRDFVSLGRDVAQATVECVVESAHKGSDDQNTQMPLLSVENVGLILKGSALGAVVLGAGVINGVAQVPRLTRRFASEVVSASREIKKMVAPSSPKKLVPRRDNNRVFTPFPNGRRPQ